MLDELQQQYAKDEDLQQQLLDISRQLHRELQGYPEGFNEEFNRRCEAAGLTHTGGLRPRMEATRIQISNLLSDTEKFTSESEIVEALGLDELQAKRAISHPSYEPRPDSDEDKEWFYQDVVQLNGKEYGIIVLLRALELADDAIFMKFLAYNKPIFSHNNIQGMASVGGGLMPLTLIHGKYISTQVASRAAALSRKVFRGTY